MDRMNKSGGGGDDGEMKKGNIGGGLWGMLLFSR